MVPEMSTWESLEYVTGTSGIIPVNMLLYMVKGVCRCDLVKDPEMGDYPKLSGRVQCGHKGPYQREAGEPVRGEVLRGSRGRGEGKRSWEGDGGEGKGGGYRKMFHARLLALMMQEGAGGQGKQTASRSLKRQENRSSLRAFRRSTFLPTP